MLHYTTIGTFEFLLTSVMAHTGYQRVVTDILWLLLSPNSFFPLSLRILVTNRSSVSYSSGTNHHTRGTHGSRSSLVQCGIGDRADPCAIYGRSGISPTVIYINPPSQKKNQVMRMVEDLLTFVRVLVEWIDICRLDYSGTALDDTCRLGEVLLGIFIASKPRRGPSSHRLGRRIGHLRLNEYSAPFG